MTGICHLTVAVSLTLKLIFGVPDCCSDSSGTWPSTLELFSVSDGVSVWGGEGSFWLSTSVLGSGCSLEGNPAGFSQLDSDMRREFNSSLFSPSMKSHIKMVENQLFIFFTSRLWVVVISISLRTYCLYPGATRRALRKCNINKCTITFELQLIYTKTEIINRWWWWWWCRGWTSSLEPSWFLPSRFCERKTKMKYVVWDRSCDHISGVVSEELHLLLVSCNSTCVLHPSELPPRPVLVDVL